MARRLPLQSPQHTQHTQRTLPSGTGIPMVPSIHSLQESPRGHTDYKTTRLQILPVNRKHKKMPRKGKYKGQKIQREA